MPVKPASSKAKKLFVGTRSPKPIWWQEELLSSQTKDDLKGLDRGEGDEAKVGGGDEVPALPGVEHDRAQHDVDHDDHDAQGDRNDHLV